jgi:hypothetical protein
MLTLVSALPFQQFVPGIMTFLRQCWNDEERTDQFSVSTLGLIGDFGDTYKAAVREELMQEWVQQAIAYGRQRGASKQAKTNALYAQKVGCAVPLSPPVCLFWSGSDYLRRSRSCPSEHGEHAPP